MERPPSGQRRASLGIVERNKQDSIEHAKARRAKALIAQEKRAQKKASQEAHLAHQEKLLTYKAFSSCAYEHGARSDGIDNSPGYSPGAHHTQRGPECARAARSPSQTYTNMRSTLEECHVAERERQQLLESLPVKERAEVRKLLEEQQYEEALRQARITTAAERRMAADRDRIRRIEEEDINMPIDRPNECCSSRRNHTALGMGKGAAAGSKSKASPFSSTWNDTVCAGGGGWAMLPNNVLDETPQAPTARAPATRTLPHAELLGAVPQKTAHRAESARERHTSALAAARKEAIAERRRLEMMHGMGRMGVDGNLADAHPAAIDAMGRNTFQQMLSASENQLATMLQPPREAAGAMDSRLLCVQFDAPRRAKPILPSQRRTKEGFENTHTLTQAHARTTHARTCDQPPVRGGSGVVCTLYKDVGDDDEQHLRFQRRSSAPPQGVFPPAATAGIAVTAATAPGKAARAAMEIQARREARRTAAEADKAQREAEVAQHGDRSNVVPRRMIENFRADVEKGLRSFRDTHTHIRDTHLSESTHLEGRASLKVAVRKRPLLCHREINEYDVLTAVSSRALICHEPKKDMREIQTCHHHEFYFDHVFDETSSTSDVYLEAVAPSLRATLDELCFRRTNLTVFAYGQTGSGKTYTMEPIYAQTVRQAFLACEHGDGKQQGMQLSISFFEIYCSKVFDLLRERAEVRTLEDAHGQVQVQHLEEVQVSCYDDAMHTIERGKNARVTHANAVHADSSRSHAVLQLLLRSTQDSRTITHLHTRPHIHTHTHRLLGKLVLVDLAGSERASETLTDDKATRHEGAEINKSLLALKECIRALGRGDKHKQFRGSKLTQVLRDGLVGQNSRAVVIVALSPASRNTEHTLNSLRYADRLKSLGDRARAGGKVGGGAMAKDKEKEQKEQATVLLPMLKSHSANE